MKADFSNIELRQQSRLTMRELCMWSGSFIIHALCAVLLSCLSYQVDETIAGLHTIDATMEQTIADHEVIDFQYSASLTHPESVAINSTQISSVELLESQQPFSAFSILPRQDLTTAAASSNLPSQPQPNENPELNSKETAPKQLLFQNRFFGKQVNGKKIVFLVDASASMSGKKFQRVLNEVKLSLRKLKKDQLFSIILYNETIAIFPSSNESRQLVEATSQVKTQAIRWLRGQRAEKLTDPVPALKHALAFQPDVVLFFSDGELPSNILQAALQHNQHKAVIHTLSFVKQNSRRLPVVLQTLAKQHGGEFQTVPF